MPANIQLVVFVAVLTIGFFALALYITWRATSVPLLARRFPRRSILRAGAASSAALFAAMLLGHAGSGPVTAALEIAGMTVLGTMFLVAVALLAVDVVTAFGLLFPGWAPRLRGAAVLVGLALAAVATVQGLRAPEVSAHEVTVAGLPPELDGRVLVAVSDTHLGAQRGEAWMDERIAEIESLRPDLVVFLGDIVEGHGRVLSELPGLRRLTPPLGKWFVEGNHESFGEGAAPAVLERAGFRRLRDQWAEVAPGLVLAGVEDLTNHRRRGLDGDPLERTLAGRPAGATILLSHTPWRADRAARAGVGLMLSGHTHGGQIWPFSYLVQLEYPLLAGRYQVEGMPVIVCRGTGGWGPPMRLWRRGEILRVTLRAPR